MKIQTMNSLLNVQIKCINHASHNFKLSVRTLAAVAKIPAPTRTGKKRFIQPAKKDAKYLVENVSGSNLLNEGGEVVKIKDDSQYPDWIWTMHLGAPLKACEIEYGTREYWDTLDRESNWRMSKLQMAKPNTQMKVGQRELFKMEWQSRIKYRALASYNYQPGTTLDVDRYSGPHMKLWLKPQDTDDQLYPDLYARENPTKFVCPITGTIGAPTEKRLGFRTRGYRDQKGGFLPTKNHKQQSLTTQTSTSDVETQ